MAKNDYSRRSSKDVFWGDDNKDNQLDFDTPASNQYEPQPEPVIEPPAEQVPEPPTEQVPEHQPEPVPEPPSNVDKEKIDVDKLIRKFDSQIDGYVFKKIIFLLIAIASFFTLGLGENMAVFPLAGLIAFFIVGSGQKYTEILKNIIEDLTVGGKYSSGKIGESRVPPIYKRIFCSNRRPIENCTFSPEDQTEIKIGNSTVHSTELTIFFTTGSGKNMVFNYVFEGEYHDCTMPNPYADGVLVCKGKMLVIKPDVYIDDKYRFYFFNGETNNSDLGRISNLCDRLSEFFGDEDFALFYDAGSIHLITKTKNNDFGDFGLLDFSVRDRLKRDVGWLVRRINIAQILAE